MTSIKLFVHRGKNRVVFAESDSDFVDVLLSFLTIPVGTFVRLCGKESNLGCMDNLYKSVESLDDERHMQSPACKIILLHPRNAWDVNLDNLPVKIMEENSCCDYICPTWVKEHCNYFSTLPDYAPCPGCGKRMTKRTVAGNRQVPAGETFIKGNRRFLITDDLQVTPLTTPTFLALLDKLHIHDATSLKQVMVANIGTDKVLGLLKRSLFSPTPLSDVFLLKKTNNNRASSSFLDKLVSLCFSTKNNNSRVISTSSVSTKLETQQYHHCEDQRAMDVNVALNRTTKKVLYVEAAGEGFVDFLFSFLTFPLGAIAKLLSDADSSEDVLLGCLHNLYKSTVENLCSTGSGGDLIILHSESHKAMLLNPKLAPYHGCKNQLLPVEEPKDNHREVIMSECMACFSNRAGPPSRMERKYLKPLNLKKNPNLQDSQKDDDDEGGGFVKSRSTQFMVTDQLHVQPLSPLGVIKQSNIASLGNLEHATVTIGREEALKLLKASLSSKTPLTDVFISTNANHCSSQLPNIHQENEGDMGVPLLKFLF